MKGILRISLLSLLMPSVACAAALPGDSADGKRLHDANCMGCHYTAIYIRRDRIVGSLDVLKKRLGDCSHMRVIAYCLYGRESSVRVEAKR